MRKTKQTIIYQIHFYQLKNKERSKVSIMLSKIKMIGKRSMESRHYFSTSIEF